MRRGMATGHTNLRGLDYARGARSADGDDGMLLLLSRGGDGVRWRRDGHTQTHTPTPTDLPPHIHTHVVT
jgi:hypothetical protein